jgi:hypothetical protein
MASLRGDIGPLPSLVLLASAYALDQLSTHQIISGLKAHDAWKVIPVLVYTAQASAVDIERWSAVGAACVVNLPSDLDSLEKSLAVIGLKSGGHRKAPAGGSGRTAGWKECSTQ